jgi:hypothetical protein
MMKTTDKTIELVVSDFGKVEHNSFTLKANEKTTVLTLDSGERAVLAVVNDGPGEVRLKRSDREIASIAGGNETKYQSFDDHGGYYLEAGSGGCDGYVVFTAKKI